MIGKINLNYLGLFQFFMARVISGWSARLRTGAQKADTNIICHPQNKTISSSVTLGAKKKIFKMS